MPKKSRQTRMSRIYLQREHGLDRQTLRRRAEALAKQLQSQYGGNYRWEGDTVNYHYSGGIDARLRLQGNGIPVDVKLGVLMLMLMLMLMLKGALRREIGRYLEEHLSRSPQSSRSTPSCTRAARPQHSLVSMRSITAGSRLLARLREPSA